MRRTPKLGQHFLTGQWAAQKLVASLNIRPDETILEIGPGKGALTNELLASGNTVIAIEKDSALIAHLETMFAWQIAAGKLILVDDDVRNIEPSRFNLSAGSYVLAANIPYYITGEIIRQFLETPAQPRALALLIQKEVAQRILAGNGKETILSLSVKAYGSPSIVAKVTKGNFNPPPSVDSAILLVDNISKQFFDGISEKKFFEVVKAGFASKRKFLANNLSVIFDKDAAAGAMSACGLPANVRAEDVSLEQWKKLTAMVTNILSADADKIS